MLSYQVFHMQNIKFLIMRERHNFLIVKTTGKKVVTICELNLRFVILSSIIIVSHHSKQ